MIVFYLKNDGNFVVPDDEYELFYFENNWISCGKKTANDFIVSFENVPSNALLLLKDLSQGSEERIFTYEENQQIWW